MYLKDLLGRELLFLDGAMGTMLQKAGLAGGKSPELWNIEEPEKIKNIHREFLDAGCNIITANTFCAHEEKYMAAGVRLTREAVDASGREKVFAAVELGPLGKLLEPMGDVSFEDAYDIFARMTRTGADEGADAIIIETMSDIYEMKAALLAAKENCSLPVIASMTFEKNGKVLTGADVKTAVTVLEGLGADVIGTNCGFGPDQIVPLIREFAAYSSVPLMANPNAGLPRSVDGTTVYDMPPDTFAEKTAEIVRSGAWLIGGCCGTTPEHLKCEISLCRDILPPETEEKQHTLASSFSHTVEIGPKHAVIGEKINPTGNPEVKKALKENDMAFIKELAVKQQQAGADILDVNTGLPEIDETEVLPRVVREIQSVSDLPLVLDTSNMKAMEKAMRIYNGKPIVNSVNGKDSSMNKVFPLAKKYGGVLIGLTLDEKGIPGTPEGRLAIASKIVERAGACGIRKKDILIDALTMTISVDKNAGETTLASLEKIKKELGVCTVLGVSNISFGLPDRDSTNAAFYAEAKRRGLDAGIIDPFSKKMTDAGNCRSDYRKALEKASGSKEDASDLKEAIKEGLREKARKLTGELLEQKAPLDVIDGFIVPALNGVGDDFEKGISFLPQLLMSAEAAQSSFDVLKSAMRSDSAEKKDRIILATVYGDIHDIGKNIVKILLENYGYEVLDLGKDVPPEKIADTAEAENVKLVGLSALMTTTVPSMEETIGLLAARGVGCRVVVGGAVLSKEYAEKIGADFYAKDAMATVRYAQEIFR